MEEYRSITIYIDSEDYKEFKKVCLEKDLRIGETVVKLITQYTKYVRERDTYERDKTCKS